MKYKVGDEVLVKCKILGTYDNERYGVTNSSNLNFGTGFKKRIYPSEKDVYPVSILQDATAEEAWEITKKFNSLSSNNLIEIFDTDDIPYILQNLTIWQIKEKIEEWEANSMINIGDEVVPKISTNDDECKFFVTYIDDKDGEISGFSGYSGKVFSVRDIRRYQKTGRHIDIDKILEQIGDANA